MGRKFALAMVAGALALGSVAVGAGSAGADTTLLVCDAGPQKATLNPPLGSGSSRYYKSVGKTTASGAVCIVSGGIASNDAATNSASGKDNPFDNQTNGQTTLHVASSVSTTSGSFTCNTTDPDNQILYPRTYPGQGKLITKFTETDALLKPLQLQAYIRLGKDVADPDALDLVVSGIVIKGVGVGGSVHAVVNLYPDLLSPKNLNLLDCASADAVGNASLAVVDVTPADGSDPGSEVDLWTVSLPS